MNSAPRRLALAAAFLLGLPAATRAQAPEVEAIVPNDNRIPAGHDEDEFRTVELEVAPGRWFPEGPQGPSEVVLAIAERGGPLRIPAPLLRVREGTGVRVTIRNSSGRELIFRGLGSRPATGTDTLRIAANTEHTIEFTAGMAGSYAYWASSSSLDADDAPPDESQLSGALIVDPAGAVEPPPDRVFVLGVWAVDADTTATPATPEREVMTINGLMWPHTERFSFEVGDTVRWRWINPTGDSHPMHLHGFYYDVTSRGTWASDTTYGPAERRTVVTELMQPGGTMSMEFAPKTPGHWLFHCHFAFHMSHFLSFTPVPAPDPAELGAPGTVDHSIHGMRGLILGITVAGPDPDPPASRDARTIRLHAIEGRGTYQGGPSYAFVIQPLEGPVPAYDSLPPLGPTLVIEKGEPVRIEVVNDTRAPTSVHWHGIEIERSYADGVVGWSGRGSVLAPPASPGGTFVAEFTPPRAGTFIYHAHTNELLQIASGLYGALIVEDPARPFDPDAEPVVILGGNGWVDFEQGRVNGSTTPAPITMEVGRTYRLRLININPDWRAWIRLKRGAEQLVWRAVAKDGADLPAGQAVVGPAAIEMGPGENADFEITPDATGDLALEIVSFEDKWKVIQPIRVQ